MEGVGQQPEFGPNLNCGFQTDWQGCNASAVRSSHDPNKNYKFPSGKFSLQIKSFPPMRVTTRHTVQVGACPTVEAAAATRVASTTPEGQVLTEVMAVVDGPIRGRATQ